MTRVVKYFFEEPASLEVLAPDTTPDGRAPATPRSLEDFLKGPRYYRGYLTASDIESGTTGASSVSDPDVWLLPFREALAPRLTEGAFLEASAGDTLITGDAIGGLTAGPFRENLAALRDLLDQGSTVFLAEPAHDGIDWAVFSAQPLADRIRGAFAAAPPVAERFVIPFVRARGEHKFYFERYDLSLFAEFRV